jgi:ATP-dependent exoDNAse (exonuclease V) beta subunit
MLKSLPVLVNAPWSPSKASLAARCGLAFKYQYVDKIKVEQKSSVSRVGVTVHRAQELLFLNHKVDDAIALSIKEAADLTTKEEETVKTFAQALSDFYNRILAFNKTHAVTEQFTEKKWAITPDFTPCDFASEEGMIRGIVDMGMLVENERLIIIDHKSGRVKPLTEYGVQLDVYTVMGQAHYPQIKSTQCAIHFVAQSKITWASPRNAEHITNVLRPWLMGYLTNRAEDAANEAPRMGRHCSWCEYKKLCPSWNSEST